MLGHAQFYLVQVYVTATEYQLAHHALLLVPLVVIHLNGLARNGVGQCLLGMIPERLTLLRRINFHEPELVLGGAFEDCAGVAV